MVLRPKAFKAIEADYLAWLAVVVPIVIWAFFLFLLFSGVGGPETRNLLVPCIVITLIGGLGFMLRFAALRVHFARGVEVPGRMERSMHLQDFGRVIYTYTYLTKEFRTTNFIHYATRTARVDAMSEITVVLNPANPHSALIKDLYFDIEADSDE
jgi:hypothetical protein